MLEVASAQIVRRIESLEANGVALRNRVVSRTPTSMASPLSGLAWRSVSTWSDSSSSEGPVTIFSTVESRDSNDYVQQRFLETILSQEELDARAYFRRTFVVHSAGTVSESDA